MNTGSATVMNGPKNSITPTTESAFLIEQYPAVATSSRHSYKASPVEPHHAIDWSVYAF